LGAGSVGVCGAAFGAGVGLTPRGRKYWRTSADGLWERERGAFPENGQDVVVAPSCRCALGAICDTGRYHVLIAFGAEHSRSFLLPDFRDGPERDALLAAARDRRRQAGRRHQRQHRRNVWLGVCAASLLSAIVVVLVLPLRIMVKMA